VSPLQQGDDSTLLAPLEQKIASDSSWAGETLPTTLSEGNAFSAAGFGDCCPEAAEPKNVEGEDGSGCKNQAVQAEIRRRKRLQSEGCSTVWQERAPNTTLWELRQRNVNFEMNMICH
jgi:hypothetical protein